MKNTDVFSEHGSNELLPGVLNAALLKRKKNQPIALGSASKMQGLFWRKRESDIILMLL
jgi:hypothetical protein